MIFTNYLSKRFKYFIFLKIIFFEFHSIQTLSQENVLNFIEITDNSKINALGGNNISLDHGYFFINPSLIKERSISINYLNYILDINSSSILFSDSSNFLGNYGIGIKYFSHGKIKLLKIHKNIIFLKFYQIFEVAFNIDSVEQINK